MVFGRENDGNHDLSAAQEFKKLDVGDITKGIDVREENTKVNKCCISIQIKEN